MQNTVVTKTALIVVRTYPTPSKTGVEVSCTAAITNEGEWLRLFPVPWRFLPEDQRFRKYQWVEVAVTKATDPRPESYKIKPDGIKVLSEPLPKVAGGKFAKKSSCPLDRIVCAAYKNREIPTDFQHLGFFAPSRFNVWRLLLKAQRGRIHSLPH